jgi:hypothetical protein
MQTDGSVRLEPDGSAEQLGPLLDVFATDMTRVRAGEFVSFLAIAPRGGCAPGAPHLTLSAPGSCRPALTVCAADSEVDTLGRTVHRLLRHLVENPSLIACAIAIPASRGHDH